MTCRICHSTEISESLSAREMMLGLREVFIYDLCASCGCLQIRHIPDDLAPYYPEAYYSFQFDPASNRAKIEALHNRAICGDRNLAGMLLNTIFNNRMLESFAQLDPPKEAAILDIGCGSGKLLHFLREQGYTHTLGIDPFLQKEITYENGLRILRQSPTTLSERFDVVMMHHAYEHVPDPHQTLREIAELLKPGGTCLIRIPWVDCEAFETYREHWVALDAPRHLHLHSLKSMQLVATQAGLDVVNHYTDSTGMQLWASEQYKNDIPLFDNQSMARNKAKQLTRFPYRLACDRKTKRLNDACRGDNAVFVLRLA